MASANVQTQPAVRSGRLRAYVALTKPRIIELLLVTTVPTMVLAARGLPSVWTLLATLVGGALAAAGANSMNSVYDRDIDSVMKRTSNRPMVTGQISPAAGWAFGSALSAISVIWLALTTNLLAAGLAGIAILLYVVGYTMILKRRTSQNIVWGGAAGCFPVLIGWAAVTGSLSWTPWILFAVIFLWTPPHYWPLSLRFRDDYDSAGVPMLPVVAAPRRVANQILWYSVATVVASLALVPVAPMGWIYSVSALLLGLVFIWEAVALRQRTLRGEDPRPMRLFHWSITYLALLFLVVAIDPLLLG
ncbi:MAG: heme o synthase [Candidatus Nanopelagicales bacterium]